MGILGLVDQNKIDAGPGGVQAPSTTFSDVFSASFDSMTRTRGSYSKQIFTGLEFNERDKKYKELTGNNLIQDALNGRPDRDQLMNDYLSNNNVESVHKVIDEYLGALRARDPERFKDVKTTGEVDASVKEKAISSLREEQKVGAGATPSARLLGGLAGGVAGSVADPINLATLPLGAGLASGIFKTMLIEAGINAGTELASYPFVSEWQKELGQDYGPADLAENMGMAALFGAGFGGLFKGIEIAAGKLPNSAKIASLRGALEDIRERDINGTRTDNIKLTESVDEIILALKHEERRLAIEEANPARYSESADPSLHRRALAEVDAAINEGRAPDFSKMRVSDDVIRSLDEGKMKPDAANFYRTITTPEKMTARAAGNVASEVSEAFDRPVIKTASQVDEAIESLNSSEMLSFEKRKFDDAFPKDQPSSEKILFNDGTGDKELTIEQIRQSFKDDFDFISAVTSCGIGGG